MARWPIRIKCERVYAFHYQIIALAFLELTCSYPAYLHVSPVRSANYHRYHRKLVKALAETRGVDSFRFDFAHAKYNQPGWVWHMAKIERDVEEIRAVVLYLEDKLGYKVDLSKLDLIVWGFTGLRFLSCSHRTFERRTRDVEVSCDVSQPSAIRHQSEFAV